MSGNVIVEKEQVRHRGISLRRTGVSHVLSMITLSVYRGNAMRAQILHSAQHISGLMELSRALTIDTDGGRYSEDDER